jgi:hypothetical protein
MSQQKKRKLNDIEEIKNNITKHWSDAMIKILANLNQIQERVKDADNEKVQEKEKILTTCASCLKCLDNRFIFNKCGCKIHILCKHQPCKIHPQIFDLSIDNNNSNSLNNSTPTNRNLFGLNTAINIFTQFRRNNKNTENTKTTKTTKTTKNTKTIENKCTICLENIKLNERRAIFPCAHSIHRKCFDEIILQYGKEHTNWQQTPQHAESPSKCPNCRHKFCIVCFKSIGNTHKTCLNGHIICCTPISIIFGQYEFSNGSYNKIPCVLCKIQTYFRNIRSSICPRSPIYSY